jgi:chromosomal replication initiator protein
MSASCEKTWCDCLVIIKQEISEQSFQTWFRPIVPKKIQNNILTIQVPNRFFYEWIEENYIPILKKAINTVIGKNCKLEYMIESDKNGAVAKGYTCDINSSLNKSIPKNIASSKSYDKSPNLTVFRESVFNSKYNFGNFVEGQCNRIVKSAATTIAQNPGSTAFNPFMIYGSVGLGKTHIAQAIGNYIKSYNSDKKVSYVPSELFASQYIHAVRENNIYAFSDKFMDVDLLIVDDVQFLSGKEKTQEIFFHIFNHLHQCGKQLIMTSDTPPQNIEGLQERLLSRFKWGLTTHLQAPDIETRVAIIEKKLADECATINSDIINYIASFGNANIRELEGIVTSIIAHASINKRAIDLDLTKEILGSIVKNVQTEDISIEQLLKKVAQYYKIEAKQIQGAVRSKEINFARKIVMYLAKTYTKHTLKSIGMFFGKRHHSTVIHAVQSISDLLATDISFKKSYSSLVVRLGIGEQQSI